MKPETLEMEGLSRAAGAVAQMMAGSPALEDSAAETAAQISEVVEEAVPLAGRCSSVREAR